MGRKKKLVNNSGIPQYAIDRFARCVFDDIRDVFADMKESKIRGYGKNRFSFNVKGGRCEACWGDGVKRIEMNFFVIFHPPLYRRQGT